MGDEPFRLGKRGGKFGIERRKPEACRHRRDSAAFDGFLARRIRLPPIGRDGHPGATNHDLLRLARDRRDGGMIRAKGTQRRNHDICQLPSGGRENFSSAQRGKMSDIRFEAVLADENDGEAASGARQLLHIERMALPVGDEQHITRLRLRGHAGERPPISVPPAGGLSRRTAAWRFAAPCAAPTWPTVSLNSQRSMLSLLPSEPAIVCSPSTIAWCLVSRGCSAEQTSPIDPE